MREFQKLESFQKIVEKFTGQIVPSKFKLDDFLVCPECAGPILRGNKRIACAHCAWGITE